MEIWSFFFSLYFFLSFPSPPFQIHTFQIVANIRAGPMCGNIALQPLAVRREIIVSQKLYVPNLGGSYGVWYVFVVLSYPRTTSENTTHPNGNLLLNGKLQ